MKEEKNVKNSGSDSFLWSLFQRLVSIKGREQPEETAKAEKQEEKKRAGDSDRI